MKAMTTPRRRWIGAATLGVVGLLLAGCASESSESSESGDPAATLEETKAPDGTELQKVTLTAAAIRRLGIEFAPVTVRRADLVVPYGAVVYDPDGGTWVYTQPGPRSFLRERVTVREIVGKEAFLSAGPEPGTEVVARATPMLYGAEQEIGA
jgi:hypothetical protein